MNFKFHLLGGLLLAAGALSAAALELAHAGKTDYTVVIAADATAVERHAAEQLATSLEQITGASFPVTVETGFSGPRFLSVGRTGLLAAATAAAPVEWPELAEDGYGIVPAGEALFLYGGDRRGALNAVYAFLEEDLGVRKYSAKFEIVPQRAELTVNPAPRLSNPAFPQMRETLTMAGLDLETALFNRAEPLWVDIPAELGGRKTNYVPAWQCHSYDLIAPAGELAAHPEYFAQTADGGRTAEQRCPSNPAFRERAVAYALRLLAENPAATAAFIGMNDNWAECHCPDCQKTGMVRAHFDLVNQVARQVAERFPGKQVGTLAYFRTGMPPEGWTPEPNVIIWLATDCVPDFVRQTPAAQNETFAKRLAAWKDLAPTLHIWDYAVTYHNNFAYDPTLYAMSENIRYFRDNQVVGVQLQGPLGSGGEREKLRHWAFQKLLWNPDLNMERLIADYCRSMFGPAAAPIEEFYLWIYDYGRKGGNFLGGMGNGNICPNRELRERAHRAFSAAYRLADDDATLRERLDSEAIPALLLRLDELNAALADPGNAARCGSDDIAGERAAVMAALLEIIRRDNITLCTMTTPVEELVKNKNSWDFQAVPVALRAGDALIPAAHAWFQSWVGTGGVDDPESGIGRSVAVPAVGDAITLRWFTDLYPALQARNGFRVAVRAKAETASGEAFELGYYDAKRGFVRVRLFTGEELGPEFRWLDAGEVTPGEIEYLYIRTLGGAVKNLRIDAIQVSGR